MTHSCDADAETDMRLALGFGAGSMGMAIALYMPALVLAPFMTNFLGIGASTVATLFLLTKIYDFISDPFMGFISDKTQSRHGRRRLYLLPGGALTAIGLVVLFNPLTPEAPVALQMQMLIGLVILYSGYTIFNVPYLAMPVEMTTRYHDRTKLMVFRVAFLNIGGLLVASSFALIERLGNDIQAHAKIANGLAVLIFVSCAITFKATANARQTKQLARAASPQAPLRSIIANKPLRLIIAAKSCQLAALSIATAAGLYFTVIVLELSYTLITTYFLTVTAGVLVTLPLWSRVSKAFGKRTAYMACASGYALIALSWLFAAAGDAIFLLYARGLALGAFGGGVLVMAPALFADVIEYDYLQTGLRREGVLSALYSSIEKIAFALGPVILLYLLSIAGYQEGTAGWQTTQPPQVGRLLYGVIGVLPASLYALSLIFLFRYDLSEARLIALRSARETMQSGA